MSEHFNLDLDYNNIENEFFLTNEEIKKFNDKINLPSKFSLIQSTSKLSFTKNKEWKIEGMQSIVDYFKNIKWIQIGKYGEPVLNNCENMLNLKIDAFVVRPDRFILNSINLNKFDNLKKII